MDYTKGEWEVKTGDRVSVDNKTICDIPTFGIPVEESQANARLIASAPDLYEACNSFICNIGFVKISDGKSKALLNVLRAEIQRAIAKAEINL